MFWDMNREFKNRDNTCGDSVPTRWVIGSFRTTSSLQVSLSLGMWNCRSPSCKKADCPLFTRRPWLVFTREHMQKCKSPSKSRNQNGHIRVLCWRTILGSSYIFSVRWNSVFFFFFFMLCFKLDDLYPSFLKTCSVYYHMFREDL